MYEPRERVCPRDVYEDLKDKIQRRQGSTEEDSVDITTCPQATFIDEVMNFKLSDAYDNDNPFRQFVSKNVIEHIVVQLNDIQLPEIISDDDDYVIVETDEYTTALSPELELQVAFTTFVMQCKVIFNIAAAICCLADDTMAFIEHCRSESQIIMDEVRGGYLGAASLYMHTRTIVRSLDDLMDRIEQRSQHGGDEHMVSSILQVRKVRFFETTIKASFFVIYICMCRFTKIYQRSLGNELRGAVIDSSTSLKNQKI